jgi:hypothetical protein
LEFLEFFGHFFELFDLNLSNNDEFQIMKIYQLIK